MPRKLFCLNYLTIGNRWSNNENMKEILHSTVVFKFTVHKKKKNEELLKHKFLVPFSNRSEVGSINIHFLFPDDNVSADPMTIL